MTPPRRLRVGHASFTVRPGRDECEALGSNAHFHGDRRRIVYRDDLPADKVREALLHEALHAAVEVCGRRDLFADDDAEEAVVHALTGPVLTLLRSNPAFVAFLTQT